MITVTKIFSFETAHAIFGYEGPCKHIHGHSYHLYVTVSCHVGDDMPLAAPGFLIDFRELKAIVQRNVIDELDHALVLSEDFLQHHTFPGRPGNLRTWSMEPSAENMLFFIRKQLENRLPDGVFLHQLKLFETEGSYAEWFHGQGP